MKRLNKEYKLDVCNHISLKYGSVNRENPQVVYISGRCWIIPKKEMNYNEVISSIEKEMKRNIKSFFVDEVNFENKMILDFDINIDGLEPLSQKFLSFDFYLRQNEKNKKKLKDLKKVISNRASTVINNLVYSFRENNFDVKKNKRDS